jgi:predicted nucleotidyltransferase
MAIITPALPLGISHIQPLLDAVLGKLQARFGEALYSVVLYGSFARGEAEAGSDIDLLVVVAHLPEEWREILSMEAELSQMGLALGRRLDIRLVEPEAVSYSVTWAAPLMLEVFDAHHLVYDPAEFFQTEMTRFGEVVRERGIHKLSKGIWRLPSVARQ